MKLARAFYKKLAKAKNLGAIDTLTYYPLELGGGEELAAATNLGALLRRLVLHDTYLLNELVAAPVLDQLEELVVQVEDAKALKAVLAALDARGLPRLRRLDVSQPPWVAAPRAGHYPKPCPSLKDSSRARSF